MGLIRGVILKTVTGNVGMVTLEAKEGHRDGQQLWAKRITQTNISEKYTYQMRCQRSFRILMNGNLSAFSRRQVSKYGT